MDAPVPAPPVIRCRSLWKIYGPDPLGMFRAHDGAPDDEILKASGHIAAVNNISLEIARGEMLVVMGLSGSGKSTLVRCLSRLIESTAGAVEIDGQDLFALDEKGLIALWRHKMGMVFQHFALLPHKTVLENVAFPLQMQGVGAEARRKRALEMIELVGLAGRENNFPRELSGGQQQRVGIARSLAVEPDIWFLDEPFSALDPLIRREMQDEFLRLQGMLKKSIVFITHDFDEALRLADRIAILHHGKVEQVGTPEEIVMSPATEYVARFTSEVPRARVLTAGSFVMAEADAAPIAPEAQSVRFDAPLDSILRRIVMRPDAAIPVTGADGELLGVVNRAALLDALFGE